MNVDIQKLSKKPKNQFEAVQFMNEFSQQILDAMFIMESSILFNSDIDREISVARMKAFIKQFEV